MCSEVAAAGRTFLRLSLADSLTLRMTAGESSARDYEQTIKRCRVRDNQKSAVGLRPASFTKACPPANCCLPSAALFFLWLAVPILPAQDTVQPQRLKSLKEIPFASLSSPRVTALGQAALSIRPTEWKHAETDNFIYHYFHGFIATPVSVEAEFYYRVVARDLNKDTSHWERKAHIFIFEQPEDWKTFQTKGGLDPWTGGIHAHGELFIQRDPNYKFKGTTLGHETAHLVIDRFYGSNVPLWLNEGYAEYISHVAYASLLPRPWLRLPSPY